MALYYLNDHGNVIFRDLDQKVYTKVGTRNDVLPNASWTPQDIENIPGFTYNLADPQGLTVYSGEQMAVAEQLYYYELLQAEQPGAQFNQFQWYTLIASVPVAGILRTWMQNAAGQAALHVRVNGGSVVSGGSTEIPAYGTIRAPSFTYGVNVDAGDLVEVMSDSAQTYAYWYKQAGGIIPFQWPQP